MRDVELIVAGKSYAGWVSMRLSRSLEQAAAAFSLSFSERWSGQRRPIPIDEGEPCTIRVKDQVALTGYVDESNVDYSATEHAMAVSGRSKAGDLVDCSAVHAAGQWKNQTLLQIAQDLVQPFAISVSSDIDLSSPLPVFSLQQGETVFDALERGARMYGCLLTSGPDGAVRFTQAGKRATTTVLTTGINIESGNRRGSWKERFSQYVVKGQSRGSDDTSGEDAATPKGISNDSAVTRARTLIVLAEDQGNPGVLATRATWERNVRAGRARRLSYTVRGWEHEGGLWEPNLRVHVKDTILRVDTELLIVSATLILDDDGARTELELTTAEAFTVLELPKEGANFVGGGS